MDTFAVSVGALLILGGLLGYARKRSVISFISGLITGMLFICGGVLSPSDITRSVKLTFAAAGMLFVGSAPRALLSRKPLPILLTAVATYALYQYLPIYRQNVGPMLEFIPDF